MTYLSRGGKSRNKMADFFPYSVLKSRDITLLMKLCIVKAMVFTIVRYGCKSWTIKKAEH